MNYHILSAEDAPLKDRGEAIFFTTDRTVGRDAGKIFSALGCADNVPSVRFARPHQTHSDRIYHITETFFSLPGTEQEALLDGIDAVVTDVHNACIGISTADCIPVLIYDVEHHAMAAIHAGWRGTVQRIVEKAFSEMHRCFGSDAERCEAVIGPGISQDSFEVGWEVHQQFLDAGFAMEDVTIVLPCRHDADTESAPPSGQQPQKPHIDLKEINRRQLLAVGLKAESIQVSPVDTFTDAQFFSARREQKGPEKCGRILSGGVIW